MTTLEKKRPKKPTEPPQNFCELHGEGAPKRIRMKRDVKGLLGLVAELGREMEVSGSAPGGTGLVVQWDKDHEMIVQPDDFEVLERHELAATEPKKTSDARTPKRIRITKRQYVDGKHWLEVPEEFDVQNVNDQTGMFYVDGKSLGRVPVEKANCKVVAWYDAAPARRPKLIRLLVAEQIGLNSFVSPGEYDYVGPGRPGRVMVQVFGGSVSVPEKNIEVVEWEGDEPTSKPLASAARSVHAKPKANGHAQPEAAAAKQPKKPGQVQPTAAAETAIAELPVEPIALHLLIRHPKNRIPLQPEIDEKAESIKQVGQLEALVVRRWTPVDATGFSVGQYQIISGETRYLGLRKNKADVAACRVIECDDARALELLALFNAKRKDLNPIEKARMIVELCKPVADGGSDYTREQAAKMYGLETGAAASNLVRLLELPKLWQDRIISGELPQKYGRTLAAIAAAPRLLAVVEQDWKDAHDKHAQSWDRENWESHEALEEFVERVIADNTRPIDKKTKHRFDYDVFKSNNVEYPRLFELTDDIRTKLEVRTFTIDKKEVELATNVAAWDELQIPLAQEKFISGKKGKAAAAGADGETEKPKPLTAAQRKAAEAEKAKKLAEHVAGWRHEWLIDCILTALDIEKTPTPVRLAIANKVYAAVMLHGYGAWSSDFGRAIKQTLPKNIKPGYSLPDAYAAVDRYGHVNFSGWYLNALVYALRTSLDNKDPRSPRLPFELADAIAAELEVDVVEEWRILQTKSEGRDRLEAFLLLHTTDQLREQAAEWKLHIPEGKPKKVIVEMILAKTTPLPLPKSIKPLAAAKPAAKPTTAKKGGKPR